MDIIVLDVDPESDEDLVRQAMEKYGEVKRCERMRMSGIQKGLQRLCLIA
jgi:hypothetical protein